MKARELFDRSLLFYSIIGMTNTFVTMGLEFLLHNVFDLPYWWFTSIPFAVTSVTCFLFNRRFSFRSNGKLLTDALKFYAVFALCFIFAFYVAKPLSRMLLERIMDPSDTWVYNISIIVGQCVFTPLNYLSQRFIVFRKKPPLTEVGTAESSD